jgi:hypothetical protein
MCCTGGSTVFLGEKNPNLGEIMREMGKNAGFGEKGYKS